VGVQFALPIASGGIFLLQPSMSSNQYIFDFLIKYGWISAYLIPSSRRIKLLLYRIVQLS